MGNELLLLVIVVILYSVLTYTKGEMKGEWLQWLVLSGFFLVMGGVLGGVAIGTSKMNV